MPPAEAASGPVPGLARVARQPSGPAVNDFLIQRFGDDANAEDRLFPFVKHLHLPLRVFL